MANGFSPLYSVVEILLVLYKANSFPEALIRIILFNTSPNSGNVNISLLSCLSTEIDHRPGILVSGAGGILTNTLHSPDLVYSYLELVVF